MNDSSNLLNSKNLEYWMRKRDKGQIDFDVGFYRQKQILDVE